MKQKTQTKNRKLWCSAFAAGAVLLTAACGGESVAGPVADAAGEAVVVVSQGAAAAADTEVADTEAADNEGDIVLAEPEGVVETDRTEEEQALAFAECMRAEGIDWPDPTTAADGSISLGAGQVGVGSAQRINIQSAEVQAGFGQCGELIAGASFLPNAGGGLDVEAQDNLLEFANCLRSEGVDVDDPNLSDGPAGLLAWDFDPDDPANADAIGACQGLFAAGQGG